MKNLIIKIDNFVLNQITIQVRKWIENHDYKKHKVDFMIKSEWYEFFSTVILAVIIPVVFYIFTRDFLNATVHVIVWGFVIAFKFLRFKTSLKDFKEIHDRHFSLRKNPEFYKMEKEVLEELFVSGRRKRIEMILGLIGIYLFALVILFFASSPVSMFLSESLFISNCCTILSIYIFYVFDFDEPKPKKKRKLAHLTDLVMKAFREAVSSLSPAPSPI